jgi:hypothetical protein
MIRSAPTRRIEHDDGPEDLTLLQRIREMDDGPNGLLSLPESTNNGCPKWKHNKTMRNNNCNCFDACTHRSPSFRFLRKDSYKNNAILTIFTVSTTPPDSTSFGIMVVPVSTFRAREWHTVLGYKSKKKSDCVALTPSVFLRSGWIRFLAR